MTETPEQRRERLARIIDGSAFSQLELMGPGHNDIVSRWSFKERIKSAYAIADAIIASDEAAGVVVVPVEPTAKMINTGTYAWMHRDLNAPDSYPIRDCYRAMIAAAKE